MERMDKAMLWGNLLFLRSKKEEILPNPLGLGIDGSFLEYIFVYR